MSWERKWQPILVFLHGESRGQRSLRSSVDWQATVHGVTKESDNNLVTKQQQQKKSTDFLELRWEGAGNKVRMTDKAVNESKFEAARNQKWGLKERFWERNEHRKPALKNQRLRCTNWR